MNLKNIPWILALSAVVINLAIALLHPSAIFMDEQVYNYASSLLLRGQSCPTIGLTVGAHTVPVATSCNYEHPPLVKLLGAVTLSVFGPLERTTATGSLYHLLASLLSFRAVQLTMGALSLPLIYTVAYGVSRERKLAAVASLLLFLDPLFAFFSRVDYLDVPMLFFALCAYAIYFGSGGLSETRRCAFSGIFLSLSLLSKETGVVFLIPLVVYHLLFRDADLKVKLTETLTIIGVEAVFSAASLQLYDLLARTPFPTFLDQIRYIAAYSSFLQCPNLCNAAGAAPWYFFLTPDYWMVGLSYNPVLAWLVLIWVPVGVFLLARAFRSRRLEGSDRLFVLAVSLFLSTFLENELLYMSGRIIWVWYFLTVLPSLALGGGYLLTRPAIPRYVRLAVCVLVLLGYFASYLAGPGLLIYD